MAEEEKGFVIKDRRAFDEGGTLKQQEEPMTEKEEKAGHAQAATESRKAPAGSEEGAAQKGPADRPPLPEADFTSLIFSLSSTALLHLGEVPEPESGNTRVDLPLAKHAVDTISMLRDKTKGNLTDEEERFVESILADLRMRYVKAIR